MLSEWNFYQHNYDKYININLIDYYMSKQIKSISSIVYKDINEWAKVRENLYENIFDALLHCINDKFEYNQMAHIGITEKQRIYLMELLEEEFYKITLNKQWSEDTSFNLIYGIQGFIQGFIKNDKWTILFNSLDAIELANILFENIKWQLDDDLHMPCLLENIPKYRCNKCNTIVEYLINFNLCENCNI